MNIGIFDSGFGGLNILKHIVKELPEYNFIYLGDTARVPYGTRSKKLVYQFAEQAVDFLFKKNCRLIVFACNTASSDALRKIQQQYLVKNYPERKVLGVLIPVAEEAVEKTKGRIGVMATQGTILSGSFEREIKKLNSKIKVFQQSCPLLVPIIEAGEEKNRITDLMLRQYLNPLLKKNIDTLILGCTHYGIIENKIKKMVGDVKVISEGKVLAKKLKDYLKRHPEIILSKNSKMTFFSTDDNFTLLSKKFFGKSIKTKIISLK